MQVLKKFGVLILISFFIGIYTNAQTTDNCGDIKISETKVKKDPIDFIHNHLLKTSTSNPVSQINTSNNKPLKKVSEKSVAKLKSAEKLDKKTEASVKLINEHAKLALKTKERKVLANQEIVAKNEVIVLPKVQTTNAVSVANDLLNSRLTTKTIVPKKEEQSFSTTMMEWVKDKYSCMIDVLPNQISNVMLYRFIDDWYGVKYRMGGTSKKGVDCSAFVQTLYKYVFGLDLLRTACLQFNSSELIKNKADLKEGDLVFFRVNTSRISHVGVYLRNNFFVHSASSKGVSIANLTSVYWSKYFAGGGRIKS